MPLADQLIRQGGYPCCLAGQPTGLKDEMLVELNKFKGTAALPQSLHLPGGLVDVGAHNDYAAIVVLRVDEVGAGEERPIRNSAQDLGDRRSGAQQEPLSLPYDLEQSGGNITQAAASLGIGRQNLLARMKRLCVEKPGQQ